MTIPRDREFEELTVVAARVEDSLRRVRGRATSPDGEVSVEVSIDGRITDLILSHWFSRMDPAESAEMLTRTHAAALNEAQSVAADIRRELTDDYRVARIVDQVANARSSEGASDQRSAAHTRDDEYFSTRTTIYDTR